MLIFRSFAIAVRYKLCDSAAAAFAAGGGVSEWSAVSTLALINVVNQHWARLLLGWVTALGLDSDGHKQ